LITTKGPPFFGLQRTSISASLKFIMKLVEIKWDLHSSTKAT